MLKVKDLVKYSAGITSFRCYLYLSNRELTNMEKIVLSSKSKKFEFANIEIITSKLKPTFKDIYGKWVIDL